jgi:hypothetical protein
VWSCCALGIDEDEVAGPVVAAGVIDMSHPLPLPISDPEMGRPLDASRRGGSTPCNSGGNLAAMIRFPDARAWRGACTTDAVLSAWAGPWAICFAVRSEDDTFQLR